MIELAKLARGNSKQKLRALALLSAHHGLLDGSYLNRPNDDIIEQKAQALADAKMEQYAEEVRTRKKCDSWPK